MRRVITCFLLCFSLLLLSSCGTEEPHDLPTFYRVFVEETEAYSVRDNGLSIPAGENAVFLIDMHGESVPVAADYNGEYDLTEEDGHYRLVLKKINYPVRVRLELTEHFYSITYRLNGAEGEDREVRYPAEEGTRVNLWPAIGLTRKGYTLCGWCPEADGRGVRTGLGSRLEVPVKGLELYAQWEPWTEENAFSWTERDGAAAITAYHGSHRKLVVPGELGGLPVQTIAEGAFENCGAEEIILPAELRTIEAGAFRNAQFSEMTLFDSLTSFSDASFEGCRNFQTLHINAGTEPYGVHYRRESVFADKVDLLIRARGQRKLVFYGGCAMWYNLDSDKILEAFGADYTIINMGLNGLINSLVQMEIMEAFLEPGDIFVHAPEIASARQLLVDLTMSDVDDRLFAGLEYDYDLLALVDIREIDGLFNSWCRYLGRRKGGGSYEEKYRDADGNSYMDEIGGLPLYRGAPNGKLGDEVSFRVDLYQDGLPRLREMYQHYLFRGVRIYVAAATIDIDQVPEEQRPYLYLMSGAYKDAFEAMEGPVLISKLGDYISHDPDYYDTVYHLLSEPAKRYTERLILDLKEQWNKERRQ